MKDRTFPFKELDPELQAYVLSFLPPQDLCMFERVSKSMRSLVLFSNIWRNPDETQGQTKENYKKSLFLYTIVSIKYKGIDGFVPMKEYKFKPESMATILKTEVDAVSIKQSMDDRCFWIPEFYGVANDYFLNKTKAVARLEEMYGKMVGRKIDGRETMLMKYKEDGDKIHIYALRHPAHDDFTDLPEPVICERRNLRMHEAGILTARTPDPNAIKSIPTAPADKSVRGSKTVPGQRLFPQPPTAAPTRKPEPVKLPNLSRGSGPKRCSVS